MPITLIKDADWAVVWQPQPGRHVYMRNVDVTFDGATITHVGKGYSGPADKTIDGTKRMVMPGLVNLHSHPEHEPAYRGIREEHGLPNMHMSGLFERSQAFYATDDEFRAAAAEFAYCELLKSGVTTLVDISPAWEGWADLLAKSGLRAFLAPGYASARWRLENDFELKYTWDEPGGRQRFEDALKVVDAAIKHPSGRLSGVISPMQIDTCTAELLRDSRAAAQERKLPLTVHIAQGVSEVQEMLRRHGKTPIQWAAEVGLLGPGTILGHAMFLDTHSWVRWWTKTDLKLIADNGCTVAHCPTPFVRYGHILENFGDYLRAGVNMGLGTDTTPHNMLEEMRKAAVLARVAARDINTVSTADMLHAATVGGANAVLRQDLGRLAPGMKADIVLIDLECTEMAPVRDPLRSLVYHAAERAVRDVYIDGRQVVADFKVLTLNQADAAGRLAEAQARMIAAVRQRDYKARTADQITPLCLPLVC
ncbi:MAG TPA: amidohydrolase family protein [Hyphomicrobiaceae bacterium]|nr:amidohydrolase family protein [Hyphomicrobiaceae bacterium]